jgi:hypothetical protein
MSPSLLFVVGAAALIFLVLAVLLPPLWRELSSRGIALVLAVTLPLLAAGVYAARGQPEAWEAAARAPAREDLDAMATRMLQRFEAGARATMSAADRPAASGTQAP